MRRPLGTASARPFGKRPGNVGPPAAVRWTRPLTDAGPADPLARDAATARVEAALFLADEPLTAKRLAEVCGLATAADARARIDRLRAHYDADGTPFQIADIAAGYQLLTQSAVHPWLLRLRRTGHDLRLTAVAAETLAVIAYRQPVTRADVEQVRGVACADIIRALMEKGLVRVAGRHDSLGRPQLYGTTKKFLQAFGLNALADLPDAAGLREP